MLTLVAGELAAAYFPEFDAHKVARFAAVHDTLEVYVGDTPTSVITEEELLAKAERERAAHEQIKQDYAEFPAFLAVLEDYEEQEAPEARFVRMVDKLMPLLVHINDGGVGLRRFGYAADAIRTNSREQATRFMLEYPDMQPIIDLRVELAEHVASQLEEI